MERVGPHPTLSCVNLQASPLAQPVGPFKKKKQWPSGTAEAGYGEAGALYAEALYGGGVWGYGGAPALAA